MFTSVSGAVRTDEKQSMKNHPHTSLSPFQAYPSPPQAPHLLHLSSAHDSIFKAFRVSATAILNLFPPISSNFDSQFRTLNLAAMAAASQATALALSSSFTTLSIQDSKKTFASLSSSSSFGLRCNALKMGVAVGKRTAVAPIVATRAAMAEAAELESPEMEERRSLEAWVKQQLPGGFAAARLIGTGRRKTAVARVVLVEGTGKIIINNRTAQVGLHCACSVPCFEL